MTQPTSTPNFQEKARETLLLANADMADNNSNPSRFKQPLDNFLEGRIVQANRSSYLSGLRRGAEIVEKHDCERVTCVCASEDFNKEILAEVEKVEKEKHDK